MSQRKTFTGLTRQRQTGRWVRAMDWFARTVITVGGIGTIVAVMLVFVFLVAVVLPLFGESRLSDETTSTAAWSDDSLVHLEVNDYQRLGWALHRDGQLDVFQVADGRLLASHRLMEEQKPTMTRVLGDRKTVLLGAADGSVTTATIEFETSLLESDSVLESLRGLPAGETGVDEQAIVEKTPQGQFRRQSVNWERGPSLEVFSAGAVGGESASEIVAADLLMSGTGGVLTAVDKQGRLRLAELTAVENLITGEKKLTVDVVHDVPLAPANEGPPRFLQLIGRGDMLLLGYRDGRLQRVDARDPSKAAVVETLAVFDDGAELTVMQPILGRSTVVTGDSKGRLSGWFVAKTTSQTPGDSDELNLVRAKRYPHQGAAVTLIAPSASSRVFVAGFADGRAALYQATTEKRLTEIAAGDGKSPIVQAALSPRDDGLSLAQGGRFHLWKLDIGHPEASLGALFGKVWYEGYPAPQHMWQSTGATVDTEVKLGMMPLVFGSIKATIYSMIFGAPLALLAAVYSSEFLDRRTRSRVKPAIEMMASLPSVVLGFLAALVFAPIVERWIPTLIVSAATVPLAVFFGAYLWQMAPQKTTLGWARWTPLFISLTLPLGVVAAMVIGPLFERIAFSGSLVKWLDGRRTADAFGSAWGGWFVMLMPLCALGAAALISRFVTPWIIERYGDGSRFRFAALELGKFLVGVALTCVLAGGIAVSLQVAGFDPRGAVLGTYEQRNALIVGFVMGFAIIPIIYTIADDALASVPESLRSASLGAGATPWQTAVRIVIPTAMSGLFSALMVGLGRAVGETMIVLMAGGNTPTIDWNPFNGFRTLSGNIATELPESVRNSTHYRTLFLAGLTLFVLTFIVNTMAEMVRTRFRRRVYQL